jgi:hypothetical protein
MATQAKSVDFSQQGRTRPWTTGTVLPSSCDAGVAFFKTDAQPGRNLFICTGPNQWHQAGGISEVTEIQGNAVTAEHPVETGQFYGWDPANTRFALLTPGPLLSLIGSTLNVASDSVTQFASGTAVPAGCDRVGLLFFESDAISGGKLSYCNGSAYELVRTPVGMTVGGSAGATIASGATSYSGPHGGAFATTESTRAMPFDAGTLSRFYVLTSSAQPAGCSLDAYISVDGASSAIHVTIPGGSAAGLYSDTSHTAAITDGQKLSVKFTNGSCTSATVASWNFKVTQ